MVGRLLAFWGPAYFQGLWPLAVSFRECIIPQQEGKLPNPSQLFLSPASPASPVSDGVFFRRFLCLLNCFDVGSKFFQTKTKKMTDNPSFPIKGFFFGIMVVNKPLQDLIRPFLGRGAIGGCAKLFRCILLIAETHEFDK